MSHNKHLEQILFDCNYSEGQQGSNADDFHNTFGNRANLHTPLTNNNDDPERQETRIRLLASFQESYLDKSNNTNNKGHRQQGEIISQPFYTENMPTTYLQNEEQYEQLDNYKCMTEKSVQQKPKKLQNYLNHLKYSETNNQGRIQQFSDQQSNNTKNYIINHHRHQNIRQENNSNEQSQQQQYEQIENAANKIKQLRAYIADQLYAIDIEDQVYKFLMHKIDNANKNISEHRKNVKIPDTKNKQEYYDQVIDHAIQFMDAADGFVKEFKVLDSMIDSNNTGYNKY